MTVIVGLKHEGKVYIGADSASVGGLDLMVSSVSKLWVKDGWAFGCTTSWRMNQLLRYALVMPRKHTGQDLMEFMCTDFINAMRNCFRDGGFMAKEKEREEGGTFLVGHAGRLFRVDSDHQVGEALGDYDACGCGEAYAKGSLFATAAFLAGGADPTSRIQTALEAAEQHSAGVRGPHTVGWV